jgi:hypothetical protein
MTLIRKDYKWVSLGQIVDELNEEYRDEIELLGLSELLEQELI